MRAFLLLCLLSPAARAETATFTDRATATETSTWKKVDHALSDGVRTARRKFIDAEEKPAKKEPAEEKPKGSGHELEDVGDALNGAWNSVLRGAGKVLKSQQTGTSTDRSTATGTATK